MKWLLATPLLLALSTPVPVRAGAAPSPARSLSAAAAKKVLPFIEDDYARALGDARSHELPLFVEVWAPW
jgi:hypothetical protein